MSNTIYMTNCNNYSCLTPIPLKKIYGAVNTANFGGKSMFDS